MLFATEIPPLPGLCVRYRVRPSFLWVTVADTYDYTKIKNPLTQENFLTGAAWLVNDIATIDSALGGLHSSNVKIVFIIPIE